MPLKRLIPTVAVIAFLLGGLAVALLAGPLWHVGNLASASAAATKPATAAPNAKAQAACDAFLKDFAGNLPKPTTPAQVVAAYKAAAKSAIDRAVTAGTMTADQATKAKAKIDASTGCASLPHIGSFGRFGGPGRAGGMSQLAGITNAAATALGVTPAVLTSGIMSGKALKDIAGPGVTKSSFDAAFRAALAKELQPQVDSGKLSKTDAQAHVDKAAAFAASLWDTPMQKAAGAFFGHGGPGKVPPGAPSTTQ